MNYETFIKECFLLAGEGFGTVAPNPFVGAVLVNPSGEIVAKGAHLKYGEAHAEVNCINSFFGDFSNLTLYINLEPCSHSGKTPPCVDLIIEKGINKVVIAMLDPNPVVSGSGVKKLQDAGIDVVCGILEDEARELNKVFIKNITTKKPFIAIKTATTLDGKIAALSGSSKWITSAAAKAEVQCLRSRFDAIMSGSGTILQDNPSLTCRNGGKSPIRIIFDRNNKVPKNANVFSNDGVKTLHITEFDSFDNLFKDFYSQGIYSILVEAGSGLNSALIEAKEVDYLYQFIAPKILGSGLGFADGIKIDDINCTYRIENMNVKNFSPDILITGDFVYN